MSSLASTSSITNATSTDYHSPHHPRPKTTPWARSSTSNNNDQRRSLITTTAPALTNLSVFLCHIPNLPTRLTARPFHDCLIDPRKAVSASTSQHLLTLCFFRSEAGSPTKQNSPFPTARLFSGEHAGPFSLGLSSSWFYHSSRRNRIRPHLLDIGVIDAHTRPPALYTQRAIVFPSRRFLPRLSAVLPPSKTPRPSPRVPLLTPSPGIPAPLRANRLGLSGKPCHFPQLAFLPCLFFPTCLFSSTKLHPPTILRHSFHPDPSGIIRLPAEPLHPPLVIRRPAREETPCGHAAGSSVLSRSRGSHLFPVVPVVLVLVVGGILPFFVGRLGQFPRAQHFRPHPMKTPRSEFEEHDTAKHNRPWPPTVCALHGRVPHAGHPRLSGCPFFRSASLVLVCPLRCSGNKPKPERCLSSSGVHSCSSPGHSVPPPPPAHPQSLAGIAALLGAAAASHSSMMAALDSTLQAEGRARARSNHGARTTGNLFVHTFLRHTRNKTQHTSTAQEAGRYVFVARCSHSERSIGQ